MIDITSRSFNLSLIFLISINLLPHIFDYALPILLVSVPCVLWRLMYEYQKVKLPPWPVKLILVIACFGAIYKTYGTVLGLEAGIVGIIMGVSLKLIDKNTYHDAMVILFLVFIVLLSQVLKDQTLWITIFAVFDVIIITGLLLQIHSHKNLSFDPKKLLVTGSKLFLKTTPLMVLLFIVFPRLSYKLNILPGGSGGSSGFSTSMSPGSIDSLALSDKVAFRAQIINGRAPKPALMYWRGAALINNKSGLNWRPAKKNYKSKDIVQGETSVIFPNDIKHKVLLPPRYSDWLFGLDKPHSFMSVKDKSIKIMKQNDIGFFTRFKSARHNEYMVLSSIIKKESLTEKQITKYTQIPKNISVKVQLLAESLKAKTNNVEELSAAIFTYFSQGNFTYKLKSSKLKGDEMEDFLFKTKKGFCEHFTAAFASLVRIAGFPARVIVGFQGGELNPYDGLITVKDKDAHSWVEVWSSTRGRWLRYDPTIAVAPLRLSLGGQAYFDLIADILSSGEKSESYWRSLRSEANLNWLNKLDQIVVTLSTKWSLFLNEYDRTKQIKLFDKIGISNIHPVFLVSMSLVIFILFYFWVRLNVFKKAKMSLIDKFLSDVYMSMEKHNITKNWNEGPDTYFQRIINAYPEQQVELLKLKNEIVELKYSSRTCDKAHINLVKNKFKEIKKAF